MCVSGQYSQYSSKRNKYPGFTRLRSLIISATVCTSNSERFSTYTPVLISSRSYKHTSMRSTTHYIVHNSKHYNRGILLANLWTLGQGDQLSVRYRSLRKSICNYMSVSHLFGFPPPAKRSMPLEIIMLTNKT